MAKCLFCTIRPRCPRLSTGTLHAPFARFAPPALNNFRHPWRGRTKVFTETPRGEGVSIFTHTKKEKQNMAKYPFLAIFPAALDASFARFIPAAMKSLRHTGGGEYPILTVTPRGSIKI